MNEKKVLGGFTLIIGEGNAHGKPQAMGKRYTVSSTLHEGNGEKKTGYYLLGLRRLFNRFHFVLRLAFFI